MANTYSQIYIQVVFAVRSRWNLIRKEWKEELYKYITGIVSNKKQKLIVINGVSESYPHSYRNKTRHCIVGFGEGHQSEFFTIHQ